MNIIENASQKKETSNSMHSKSKSKESHLSSSKEGRFTSTNKKSKISSTTRSKNTPRVPLARRKELYKKWLINEERNILSRI